MCKHDEGDDDNYYNCNQAYLVIFSCLDNCHHSVNTKNTDGTGVVVFLCLQLHVHSLSAVMELQTSHAPCTLGHLRLLRRLV